MTLIVDPSGVLSANLVSNEATTTTAAYASALKEIYPGAGPFYATGLIVQYVDTLGNASVLALGTDYSLQYSIPLVIASNGSAVYGAVRLKNLTLNGTIKLTYQALGGSWFFQAADIASYQTQNVLNPITQMAVLSPDPSIYAATNSTVLDSFTNIIAFQTLFAPVKLGVQYVSISGSSTVAPGNTGLAPNASQETGGNLDAINASTASASTKLSGILAALQAQQTNTSTVWFDGNTVPPTYYVRRESTTQLTGVTTVSWETPAGAVATPVVANLQAVSNSENIHSTNDTFVATAASSTPGTVFAIGDILVHTFGIDMAVPTPVIAYSFWMNLGPSVANGTIIGTPAGGTFTSVATPLAAGASTAGLQTSGNASLTAIAAALSAVLVTEDAGLASIVDSTQVGYVYFCEAAPGSLQSAAVWRVSQLNTTTGQTLWANGVSSFTTVATAPARYSLAYS